jgi:D-alanyl-D-alanine carboxypeptidase
MPRSKEPPKHGHRPRHHKHHGRYISLLRRMAGVADATDRGWGQGWPHCQTDKIVPLTVKRCSFPAGVRREIKELATILLEETERRGYHLHPGWCWGFSCRPITGTTTVPSNHSWGLALDINAPSNPYGPVLHTDMPSWMPRLWARYGFRWGGTYSGNKDAMHFEYVKSRSSVARYTRKARRELRRG